PIYPTVVSRKTVPRWYDQKLSALCAKLCLRVSINPGSKLKRISALSLARGFCTVTGVDEPFHKPPKERFSFSVVNGRLTTSTNPSPARKERMRRSCAKRSSVFPPDKRKRGRAAGIFYLPWNHASSSIRSHSRVVY